MNYVPYTEIFIAINVQVYTWGKGYCGALGHGGEIDQRTPLRVDGLKSCRAVQVALTCIVYITTFIPCFFSACLAYQALSAKTEHYPVAV